MERSDYKSINVDRFYTPRRYRPALCEIVKLFQTLCFIEEASLKSERRYQTKRVMGLKMVIFVKQLNTPLNRTTE